MEHFYMNMGENWFDFQDIYSRMVDNSADGSHFVEVGSWKGRSASYLAVEIINSDKTIKFDCVDTWLGSVEHKKPTSIFFQPKLRDDEDWLYNKFLENVKSVGDVINPIRTSSLKAAALYPDKSLDFVFIDASHEYKDVLNDLHAWYPVDEFFGTNFKVFRNSYLHEKSKMLKIK